LGECANDSETLRRLEFVEERIVGAVEANGFEEVIPEA
jgi:hypothetical protein